MKKRIFSILMCACLALALLPKAALADGIADYDIWVGGVRVTSANAGDVLGDGTVSYDAQADMLALDSAHITGTYTDANSVGAAIYANTDLTIALTGDSSSIGPLVGASSCGVYGSGTLDITGSGSLSAIGGTATSGYSFGVYGDSVTISDDVRVNAVGGAAVNSGSAGVVSDGGNITVSGSARVTAKGGVSANWISDGMGGGSIIISDSAQVTAVAGRAEQGSWGLNAGIHSIDISGGTVTAVGGECYNSCGMYSTDTTVTGGVVTATGGKSSSNNSYGAFCNGTLAVNNGDSTANNSLLVAKGDTCAANTAPICGDGSAALTGAESENFAVWGETGKYFVLDSREDSAVPAGTLAGHAQLAGTGLTLTASAGSSSGDPATAGYSWTDSDSDGTYDTLTLKNVILNAPDAASGDAYGVELPDGGATMTINSEGLNIIRAGDAADDSCGVYYATAQEAGGNITISGGGALYALGGSATTDASCGIQSDRAGIAISGGTIVALGGSATNMSCGVCSWGVDGGGNVDISGGGVTAVGGAANADSLGVLGYLDTAVSGGTVTAVGGAADAGESYGLYGSQDTITGGVVTAVSGTASSGSYGVYGDDTGVTVGTGVVVTAVGGKTSQGSFGIRGGTVMLSGTVTAVSSEADNGGSHGVYGNSSVTVGAGTVTSMGGGYGMASAGSICLNGGTTIAAGGVRAMSGAPDLTGYTAAHALAVGSRTDGSNAGAWDESTGLDTYKYLKIAPLYALTVALNGGSGATVGGDHAAGEVVSIDAGTKSGYTFSGWTATGGGTFANAAGTSTTYTMPAGAATITVNWTANFSGGGSYGGTATVPVSSGTNQLSASASVSGGTASLCVTDAQAKTIASGAKAAGIVKLDVSALKANTVVVPSKLISAVSGAALEVALPAGTVALDETALNSIADKGDVKLSVETVDNSKLTDTQKAALGKQAGTATVVDVNLYAGGSQVSTFGDGTLRVSIPYTLKAGENADSVTVWFLKDDGTIEPKSATYADGKVTFTTRHLSRYLIVDLPFTDVAESAWYYGGVAYTYNSGLLAGTSDTTFSPNTAMTRQMVWMVLARVDGKAPASMDEAKAWAVENKISDGSNPTSAVTREQLAATLYRYAQDKGYDASVGEDTNILSYDDALTISEYAIPAIQWTCGAGLMQGSGNKLMPFGTATRAQVAAILQRFCANAEK